MPTHPKDMFPEERVGFGLKQTVKHPMTSKKSLLGSSPRRIALLVETSMGSGREIVKGVARYARESGQWSVYHEPSHVKKSVPDWLKRWQGDGIIARVRNKPLAAELLAIGLPVIDVLGDWPTAAIPIVQVDDNSVADLAASHLLERGFRQFGFCGIGGRHWALKRQTAFVETIGAAGYPCAVYQLPVWDRMPWFSEDDRQQLVAWVEMLPKPAGVMACNDLAGQRVLAACRQADVPVPEEVAVVGVDNDEPLCEISDPTLSSIIPVHEQVGYAAAALVDGLISGQPAPEQALYLKATEIVVRRSSDVLAVDDPDLATALRFIRTYACDGIAVCDVVKSVGLSRSTLDRRFREAFGRSVHEEIVRVRLQRIKELLAHSELPLITVARKTGFSHQEYFGAVFKAQTGMTPNEYRQEHRRPGPSGY